MGKKPVSGISPEDAELFKAAVAKVEPLPHEPRAAAPRARAKRAPVQSSERPAQGLTFRVLTEKASVDTTDAIPILRRTAQGLTLRVHTERASVETINEIPS